MDELPPPDGLDDALAGGRPPSLDDFRGVLSRHRRGQLQRLSAGLAVAVVIAGAVGYVAGNSGRGSGSTRVTQTGAAASPAASAAGSPVAGGGQNGAGYVAGIGTAVGAGGSGAVTQLLVRNADDGVRVRLYQQALDKGAPAGACIPTGFLQAEVSDDQVAGTGGGVVWAPPTSAPLDPLGAQIVGAGEPQPILTVVSHTGAGVAKVTLTTGARTDHAAPTAAGWVALAIQLPATADSNVPDGTLTATAADGTVLATDQLSTIGGGKTPPCMPTPACEKQVVSGSGGGSGTVSSGGGGGSGTASSGSSATGTSTGIAGGSSTATAGSSGAVTAGSSGAVTGGSGPGAKAGAGPVCTCQVLAPATNGPSGTTGVSESCSMGTTGSGTPPPVPAPGATGGPATTPNP